MLQIFLLIWGVNAFGLPAIYSRALAKQIDSVPLIKAIFTLDTQIQCLLPLSGTEDIRKFYALITHHQKALEAPLRVACEGRRECLRLCSLLVDALEIEYRERQLKEEFSFYPSSMSEGVLFQAQHIRVLEDLAPSNYKNYFIITKKLDYVLLYLQLWEAIERFGYGAALGLVAKRQMCGLRKLVQRSTDFYMNWLYRESVFLYPPLVNGTLPYWLDATTWYHKITGTVFPMGMTHDFLASLLKNSVRVPLLQYQKNPASFDIRSYFALITDMLFLHQSHIELCSYGNKKQVCMELESTLTELYALLEKLFETVLKFMEESTVSLYQFELPTMSILRTTRYNYNIIRAEVLFVNHSPLDKFIITTQVLKSGTLRIHLLGADKNLAIALQDIKEAVLTIFKSQRSLNEEELNRYLEERVISRIKLNGRIGKVTKL